MSCTLARRAALLVPAAFALLGLLDPAPARACSADDGDDDGCESGDTKVPRYQHEPAIGVGLDLLRGARELQSATSEGTFGLRTSAHFRLGERIALSLGLEESVGTDPSGHRRYDLAWSLPDVYVYLTPRSSMQLYTVLGMDVRISHFEAGQTPLSSRVPWAHSYLGASLGGGVESRLSKSTAVRVEARGFLRGRTSDRDGAVAAADPAFDEATRTQRGLLLSVGVLFF